MRETKFKIVVVGDPGAGKTCLLSTFVNQKFPENYIPTVFENYETNLMINGEKQKLLLVDSAGQEEYAGIRKLSYPGTHLFLLCFDTININSFAHLRSKWIPEIQRFAPGVPFLLIQNKTDLLDDPDLKSSAISPSLIQELCDRFHCDHLTTSAKKMIGIKQVFDHAIQIIQQDPSIVAPELGPSDSEKASSTECFSLFDCFDLPTWASIIYNANKQTKPINTSILVFLTLLIVIGNISSETVPNANYPHSYSTLTGRLRVVAVDYYDRKPETYAVIIDEQTKVHFRLDFSLVVKSQIQSSGDPTTEITHAYQTTHLFNFDQIVQHVPIVQKLHHFHDSLFSVSGILDEKSKIIRLAPELSSSFTLVKVNDDENNPATLESFSPKTNSLHAPIPNIPLSGSRSTLTILGTFSDHPTIGCNVSTTTELMYTGNLNVNSFFNATSHGNFYLDGKVDATPGYDVYEIYQPSPIPTCNSSNLSAWMTNTANLLETAHGCPGSCSSYLTRLFLVPKSFSCGSWLGVAFVTSGTTSTIAYSRDCTYPDVIAHEIGHNLRFAHSSTPQFEYGDLGCTMGGAIDGWRYFNTPKQLSAGWLSSSIGMNYSTGNSLVPEYQEYSSPSCIFISSRAATSHDQQCLGHYAAKYQDTYIEYTTQQGYDISLNKGQYLINTLRLLSWNGNQYDPSTLLHILSLGQSEKDIHFLSANSQYAIVWLGPTPDPRCTSFLPCSCIYDCSNPSLEPDLSGTDSGSGSNHPKKQLSVVETITIIALVAAGAITCLGVAVSVMKKMALQRDRIDTQNALDLIQLETIASESPQDLITAHGLHGHDRESLTHEKYSDTKSSKLPNRGSDNVLLKFYPGQTCFGRLPEDDSAEYIPVVISSIENDVATVYFPDFGSEGVLPVKYLKE